MIVQFWSKGEVPPDKLKYTVIAARHKDEWVYVRHRERDTWEMPGGHRNDCETSLQCAVRELFEETGAKDYSIREVELYSVKSKEEETFGALFYAEIESFGDLPQYEIAKVEFFKEMPTNLTYPHILPQLHERIETKLRNHQL